MRVGDILFFSPKYKFTELDWNDKGLMIRAFEDRVRCLYLQPAEYLNRNSFGFASGLICVTTIDFLARLATGKEQVDREDFKNWLMKNIPKFNQSRARKFYDDFRCGLVHEGRIKNCGQFSYEIGDMILQDNEVMVVNPKLLIDGIEEALRNYLKNIREDDEDYQNFKNPMERFQKRCQNSRRYDEVIPSKSHVR